MTGSEIGQGLFGGILKEFRAFPFTVLTVIALWAVTMLYVIPKLQQADAAVRDIPNLRSDVKSVRLEMLRVRISMLDNTVTQLELEKGRSERVARPVPPVITELLQRANSEREMVVRELDAMLNKPRDADAP